MGDVEQLLGDASGDMEEQEDDMMTLAVTPQGSPKNKAATPAREAALTNQLPPPPARPQPIRFTNPEAPPQQDGDVRPLRSGRQRGPTNPETLSSATAAAAEGFHRVTEEASAAAGAEPRLRNTVTVVQPTGR